MDEHSPDSTPSNRPKTYRTQNRGASAIGCQLITDALNQRRDSNIEIVRRASQFAYRNDGVPEASVLARGCSVPTFRRFCRGEIVRRFREFCEALGLDDREVSGEAKRQRTEPVTLAPELAPCGCDRLPAARHVRCLGRDRELADIVAALQLHPRLYVRGARGVGKTTIADEIVRHAAIVRRFSRRIRINVASHLDLGSRQVPRWRAQRSIDAIERELARACSPQPSEAAPLDRDVLFARLAAEPTLIAIDDLDNADDLGALLGLIHDLPDGVCTIATGTAAINYDRIIKLLPLSPETSRQLVDACCRDRSLTVAPADRQWLHETTYGFPAAIVKAVALFVESGRWQHQTVAAFSEACWTDYIRLALQQLDDDARTIAAAVSLFPQPIDLAALADIAAIAPDRLPDIATRLHDLALIDYDDSRHTCTTRRLEREGLARYLADRADGDAIRQRWVGRYCRLAADLMPDDWRVWEDYTTVEREWENWLAALEWCVSRGDYDRVRDLWAGLRGYTNLHGYWKERLRWLEWAIDAAGDRGDRLAQARFWRDRAWTLALTDGDDHYARAEADFDRAILLAREAREAARQAGRDDDPIVERAWQEFQSELALERTVLCLETRDLERARDWLDRERDHLDRLERLAQQPQRQADDRLRLQIQRQRIRTDYYEAEIFFNRRDYARARQAYLHVFQNARALGWDQFCAYATNWLADIALCDRSYEAAESWLGQTWRYLKGQRDRRSLGFYYQSLARTYQGRGIADKARQKAHQAANAFADIGQTARAQRLLADFQG